MARWGEPSSDTIKIVSEVINNTDLERFIGIKVILNDDQKKDVVKVKKLTPDIKFALGDDLLLIINEVILEQLPIPQQLMCIEEAICGVSFDAENERLVITQPDVKTHSGFLQKHTYEKYEVMTESIKSLYDKEKEEKDANGGE